MHDLQHLPLAVTDSRPLGITEQNKSLAIHVSMNWNMSSQGITWKLIQSMYAVSRAVSKHDAATYLQLQQSRRLPA